MACVYRSYQMIIVFPFGLVYEYIHLCIGSLPTRIEALLVFSQFENLILNILCLLHMIYKSNGYAALQTKFFFVQGLIQLPLGQTIPLQKFLYCLTEILVYFLFISSHQLFALPDISCILFLLHFYLQVLFILFIHQCFINCSIWHTLQLVSF